MLAKPQQKVHRQRADFHHKTALALVRATDTIYVESVLAHPRFQSSIRWEADCRRAACLHQPEVFWL
jgi:hypothetical protein